MDGRALLERLQDGTLPAAEFNHYNHVRAAWHCLNALPLREAAHSFRDVLLSYVRRLGAEDKFHLTLTFAFMHLIHERMKTSPADWEGFVAANVDLFEDAKAVVAQFYSAGRLLDERAKRQFVEPDLAPLPSPIP